MNIIANSNPILDRKLLDGFPPPDFVHIGKPSDLKVAAVMTACRPLEGGKTEAILTFETPSSTEWQSVSEPAKFLPNFFVTVSESDMEAKILGMEAYVFEKRPYPHPRSPEGLRILAQRYGVMLGGGLFEAFQIIRMLAR
jgi:N-acetylglucosamine malate deacetylase 1